MDLKFDAAGYAKLGSLIYAHGLAGFFTADSEKVILYPWIIAQSMHGTDFLPLSYLKIQTIIQVLCLGMAQFMIFKMLAKLNINQTIIAAIVLYFGFSPALVNSAFSLFCEIITYPLVLGIIFLWAKSWNDIQEESLSKITLTGLGLGLLFAITTLVRAVYEYIIVIFLFVYFLLALYFLFKKYFFSFRRALVVLITVGVSFHVFLLPYKYMTTKYAEHRSLLIIGAQSLYANAAGRTRELSKTDILTFLAYVPGDGVCKSLFTKEQCGVWLDDQVHELGVKKVAELRRQGVPNDQLNSTLYRLTFETIVQKPIQYSLLNAAESMKLLFWESTQVGFVNYPAWLRTVFDLSTFKNGLRLVVSLITIFCLFYSLIYVIRNLPRIYRPDPEQFTTIVIFFMVLMILSNLVIHSPFKLVVRYAFPFVPLYLVLIGFTLQKLFIKR